MSVDLVTRISESLSQEGPSRDPAAGPLGRPRLSETLPAVLFLVLTYALYVYVYARSPVFAGDTDVWYHLTGGRYFWSHLKPPTENFFSFLRPVRPWTDYYWLFQALIYRVYQAGGYYGLVLYRLLAFLAAQTAILLILFRPDRLGRRRLLWASILFFLFGLVLSTRYFLVRPHTFSYLFVALFLLVMERGRKWAFVLPPMAVVWVNVHGITYPVLFLICLSYLGELGWKRLRTGELEASELRLAVILTLCLFAVYATPHGSKLLRVPFISTRYAAGYINELAPVQWKGFLSGEVDLLAPSSRTAFHLILLATLGCVLSASIRRTLAPSHLFLFVGAAFLMTKGTRMGCEFSLLSAPLLARAPWQPFRPSSGGRRAAWIGAFAGLVFAQVVVVRGVGWTSWKFPFSPRNLPVGVTHFLQTAGPGGRVLNDHNTAGYVEWALYPRYSIFMDMEVPYLFTDEDMFLTVNAFRNAEVFGKLVRTYHPDFLSVPISNKKFGEIVEGHRAYKPVFFDDAEVLYVDAERHPALAARYELKEIKPHELAGERLDELLEKWDEADAVKELRRMSGVYADCALVNQVLSMVALRQKDFSAAERYADRLIGTFPEAAQGYKLKADALQRRGSLRPALDQYGKALTRADSPLRGKIRVEMGQCYRGLGEYSRAYGAFSKGIDVHSADTTFKDLYYLGSAAYLIGKPSEAEMLYRFALAKVPSADLEWRKRLETHLALFKSGAGGPQRVESPHGVPSS